MAKTIFMLSTGESQGAQKGEHMRASRQSREIEARYHELHEQYRLAVLLVVKIRSERAADSLELKNACAQNAAKDKEIASLKRQMADMSAKLAKLEHIEKMLEGGSNWFGGDDAISDFLGLGKKKPGK